MPGMDLAVIGPIQTTGDMSTYTWALAGKDGNAVVKGRDVITVKHERIIRRYVFFRHLTFRTRAAFLFVCSPLVFRVLWAQSKVPGTARRRRVSILAIHHIAVNYAPSRTQRLCAM